VNHHQCPEAFVDSGAAHLGPIIYLLYRPDHYDILYRLPNPIDIPAPASNLVYQVNRVTVLPPNISLDDAASMGGVQDLSGVDFGLLGNMLPNFFSVTDSSMASHPAQGSAPTSFTTQPTAWADHYDEGLGAASSAVMPSSMAGISSNPSTPMTPASTTTTVGSGNVPTGAGQLGSRGSSSADCQIRFSNAQYDYDEISDQFKVQTSTFKNSVYNTAHYRNPNFHPEECRPDGEPFERRSSTKKKKRQDA
jgi:ubiquitin thioesterase protein OTUB1